MEDVMLHFSDNSLSSFMSKEELAAVCSNAFKTMPTNPKVSARYVQANTETVVDDLAKLGWYPVEANQCKQRTRKDGKVSVRSFHMIAFQNPNFAIVKNDGTNAVECFPRIILTNSHDGFNSFRFRVGLFRLVCSNGLVIGTDNMVDMSIRHMNYTFETLREKVRIACKQAELQAGVMGKMNATMLDENQKEKLAESAIRIRKGIPEGEQFKIDPASIQEVLTTHRDEDKGDSLWNVFNVIQENLMKGDYTLTNANGKTRKQRPIKSPIKSIGVNVELFKSAAQFLPKEAA